MSWEAISALAEVVGVIAVMVSLIYLAVQIRQNTRQITSSIEATRLAAFESNIESGNRVRELFILHPELIKLYVKGKDSFVNLEPIEKFRFGMLVRNIFSEIQGSFIRQLSIEHDPHGVQGMTQMVDDILTSPGVREFLATYNPDWRPEFRNLVDERLAKIEKSAFCFIFPHCFCKILSSIQIIHFP